MLKVKCSKQFKKIKDQSYDSKDHHESEFILNKLEYERLKAFNTLLTRILTNLQGGK